MVHDPDGLIARPGQSLHDHLINVANLSEQFAARFNAGAWGRACGLFHDIGKGSAQFQLRVRGDTQRRVDHSTAGARALAAAWKDAGKLLAYCVAGHHSGLADGKSNNTSCLAHRLNPAMKDIPLHASIQDILGCFDVPAPPTEFPFAVPRKGLGLRMAFFVRMLFSCLVDADRMDAESVGDADRSFRRGEYPSLEVLAARLDSHLVGFSADTDVRRIRAQVLAACRSAASQSPGLFSLTVPTGGGKTLSSLAFALEHALRHGLSRVVYVIPYTSIIEQNAQVFRNALGDADSAFVVEHHSNVTPDADAGDDKPHPATENWDAPVIVTTSVQFFESLYSHKAGRCRKLHNLAGSVIILDEAQMLPLPYLLPCIEALRELTEAYGASVVLCTATQPALNASDNPDTGLKGGLTGVREIMPDPHGLHESLKRVTVEHVGELSDADLAGRLAGEPQVLCIVNTRRQARRIYDALLGHDRPQPGLFHLSALMCPQHRTERLDAIRHALANRHPCRVVSTTLVEAGVDLDFPVVFRAEGGIDGIAQAAGRCNREGRLDTGRVYVFLPEGGVPRGDLRRAAQAARSVLERHKHDLLHPDAVRDYFLERYWQLGLDELDKKRVLTLLSEGAVRCWFPFRTIGESFKLIDSNTQGLIIPYDDAAHKVVRALDALAPDAKAGALLRQVQRHTVSLYTRDIDRLEREGAVRRTGPGGQFFVLANSGLYSQEVGLDIFRDDSGVFAPGDLIM